MKKFFTLVLLLSSFSLCTAAEEAPQKRAFESSPEEQNGAAAKKVAIDPNPEPEEEERIIVSFKTGTEALEKPIAAHFEYIMRQIDFAEQGKKKDTIVYLEHFSDLFGQKDFQRVLTYMQTAPEEQKDFLDHLTMAKTVALFRIYDLLQVTNKNNHLTSLADFILESPSLKGYITRIAPSILLEQLLKTQVKTKLLNSLSKCTSSFQRAEKLTAWNATKITTLKDMNLFGLTISDIMDHEKIKHKTTPSKIAHAETFYLDLSWCCLTSLEGLERIKNKDTVTSIDLSYNNLTEIGPDAFKEFPQLENIKLSNNSLERIAPSAFSGLSQLKMLYLDNNKITTIEPETFAPLLSLQRIHLNSNTIKAITADTFPLLPQIRLIDLDNNKIETMAVTAFTHATVPAIRKIFLSGNALTEIKASSFVNLPHLKMLLFNKNKITHIEAKAFDHLPVLESVNFRRNQLTTFVPHTFTVTPLLKQLWLRENKIAEEEHETVMMNIPPTCKPLF